MSKEYSEITKVAVQWWLDSIGVSAKRYIGLDDSKDSGIIAGSMLLNASSVPKSDTQSIEKFTVLLSDFIEEYVSRDSLLILSTDYTPDYPLLGIVRASEISAAHFPMKTVMWIKHNSIDVRAGYQAKTQNLFSIEE